MKPDTSHGREVPYPLLVLPATATDADVAKIVPGTYFLQNGQLVQVAADGTITPGVRTVTEGTPVTPVAATGTTAMSGSNNDWDLTAVVAGVIGNSMSLTIVLDDAKFSAPTVDISESSVTITAGAKARMQITGTLTSDGSTPVVFPVLNYAADSYGKPAYTAYSGGAYSVSFTIDSVWLLVAASEETWESNEDVATPDLVTTWTPVSPATGTPTVTALAHTATQCKTAFDATAANENLFTLANKSGNNGSGAVTAVSAVTLSGGVDGTAAPAGAMLYDSDNLYLAIGINTTTDISNWKKLTLASL